MCVSIRLPSIGLRTCVRDSLNVAVYITLGEDVLSSYYIAV